MYVRSKCLNEKKKKNSDALCAMLISDRHWGPISVESKFHIPILPGQDKTGQDKMHCTLLAAMIYPAFGSVMTELKKEGNGSRRRLNNQNLGNILHP